VWIGLSAHPAAADELRFSHHITLHPVPSLASVVSFVPGEGEELSAVRALLLLDGELLSVPLIPEAGAKSYRGTFPTPKQSLSYRFQIVKQNGGARLSQSYVIKPECPRAGYSGPSLQVKGAILAQHQRERLRVSKDLLLGFLRRIGQ